MIRKVKFTKLAEFHLAQIINYLDKNWPQEVRKVFIQNIEKSILLISKYPEAFPISKAKSGLHKYVLTPHNTIYYRINKDQIEIIMIFDNRQNPAKLKKSGK